MKTRLLTLDLASVARQEARSLERHPELGIGLDERARVILEKPFGTDLESARELNATVHRVFDETQVFRFGFGTRF